MLEISHHSTSIARGCWKKFYWYYIQKIKPRKRKSSLFLGTTIHKAFELYYSGATNSDVINYITDIYSEEIAKSELVDQENLIIDKYTALGMWSFYPYKDLNEFEEVITEKEFSVLLGKKRGVRFVGRVDGIVKRRGLWWVREIKTTGLALRQFTGRCNTSSQATGYVYGMKKLGYDIQGVMYDTIKRPMLRKRVTESGEDFGKRIMSDYLGDSKMPENERKAFLRHFEYRSQTQLSNWVEDQSNFIDDLRYKLKHNNWYRDLDNCWKYNSLCDYDKICGEDEPDSLTLQLYYDKEE